MGNVNQCIENSSEFNSLKSKEEFSLLELEKVLNINANTILKYSTQFKDMLSSQDKFNQKDIDTLILIESMTQSGLDLTQIATNIFEYQQLLKQTLNGTSNNPIKFLESYPQASGLKRPQFKRKKCSQFL
jgi:hypothetical protein